MTARITLIDGRPAETLDVMDRGLHFGDGVFETLRVDAGQPRFLHRHLQRLSVGCERLGIDAPDRDTLEGEIRALAGQAPDGVIKLIVTRGSGERGYTPMSAGTRRLTFAWPSRQRDDAHCRLRLCETRLAHQPLLAGIKHLNRLEQILARRELRDSDVNEGLLMDYDGHLVEGSMSNLFLVKNGALLTPDLSSCGVAGVMRSVVMDTAQELGLHLTRGAVGLEDLRRADEVFVCNSLMGVRAVVEWVAHKTYPSGPVTTRLREAVEKRACDDISQAWYSR
jgi:4-amino-4-deoxychorismate lyase